MPDRKNQNHILKLLKAIKGYVARAPAGDHQFSQAMFDGPTDQWMADQHFNRFLNQPNRLRRRAWICCNQEVG